MYMTQFGNDITKQQHGFYYILPVVCVFFLICRTCGAHKFPPCSTSYVAIIGHPEASDSSAVEDERLTNYNEKVMQCSFLAYNT